MIKPIPITRPGLKLRSPHPSDAKARFALGRDPEITRMYGVDPQTLSPWTLNTAADWVAKVVDAECAWIIENNGDLIGAVRLHSHDPGDHRAQLAIGLEDATVLGQGIGRRVIGLVLDYAFRELGLHRVGLRVLALNLRAIRCYSACGFRHEGVERQSARIGDAWYDDFIMGILADEYFALSHERSELHSSHP
jgi:RimJ/RimL family protein N-acetyltransferase